MRDTGFGPLYDELKSLRAERSAGERLRAEKELYLGKLKEVRTLVAKLELAETDPELAPAGIKPKRTNPGVKAYFARLRAEKAAMQASGKE
jgi:hypothetical protein